MHETGTGAASRITIIAVGTAVSLPLANVLVVWALLGASYRPSSLVFALAVADALVLAAGATVANRDLASARRLQRQPYLTKVSLIVASSVMVVFMLAGGVALEHATALGGPGSSTNAVAVFAVPALAAVGATLGYGVVWITGSLLPRRMRRSG